MASALAASALQAGLVLSTQSSTPLEDVAQAMGDAPGRGPLWFQLYLQHDRGFTRELVQRAERAGYEALVLTVDAPCHGARDRERRAGFRCRPASARSTWTACPTRPHRRWARPERPLRRPAEPGAHLGRRGLAAIHHPAAGAAQGHPAPG
jgi:4-hydroxymandelate oxidase